MFADLMVRCMPRPDRSAILKQRKSRSRLGIAHQTLGHTRRVTVSLMSTNVIERPREMPFKNAAHKTQQRDVSVKPAQYHVPNRDNGDMRRG